MDLIADPQSVELFVTRMQLPDCPPGTHAIEAAAPSQPFILYYCY